MTTWHLYNRQREILGTFTTLEAAMCVLGTNQIGLKWLPTSETSFVTPSGFSIEKAKQPPPNLCKHGIHITRLLCPLCIVEEST